MPTILHLTTLESWQASQASGEYEAPSLTTEGFIHCSADEDQALRVAARLYAAQPGLVVLDVDTDRLTAEVRREPSRSGEIYPHIYGRINRDAVVRIRPLTVDAEGQHRLETESLPPQEEG